MPCGVVGHHRVIIAVRKHIVAEIALSGARVAIRIDKPPQCGVIVSGLQVIETGFGIVVIATVADGVQVCELAGLGENCAVGVVSIAGHGLAGGIDQMHHVALQVQDIVVGSGGSRAAGLRGQVQHIRPVVQVIEEVQRIICAILGIALPQQQAGGVGVVMPDAVHLFPGAQAVDVVVKAQGRAGLDSLAQLSAVSPAQCPGGQITDVEIACGVASLVIGIAAGEVLPVPLAADRRQQIPPVGVVVLWRCIVVMILHDFRTVKNQL